MLQDLMQELSQRLHSRFSDDIMIAGAVCVALVVDAPISNAVAVLLALAVNAPMGTD